MNKCKRIVISRLSTAMTAIGLAACALSTNAVAQTLNYSQSAGFYSGATTGGVTMATLCTIGVCGSPVAGHGGLDFYTNVLNTPFPASTWEGVAWGCVDAGGGVPPPGTCANSGVVGFGFPGGIVPQVAGRSSLEVSGQAGTLDTVSWQPITVVQHHNHVIDTTSNMLDAIDVSSFLRIGNPVPFFAVDGPGGSVTSVLYTETPNLVTPCQAPPGAPPSPLTSGAQPCDDFAFVSGLDLSSLFIPANAVGNPQPLQINFRLTPTSPGALVCGQLGPQPPDPRCSPYNGTDLLIYTAENGDNSFQIEAQLSPVITVALFVIGDCEFIKNNPHGVPDPNDTNNLREIGDEVNFWGAQWWKNNCMSVFTSNGYPAFKGYSTNAVINQTGVPNCGQWEARPGNSGNPPNTLPDVIRIIVTDNVIKNGPNIGGNIKQLVEVTRHLSNNDNYAGNPGHQGWGVITNLICGPIPAPGAP